MTIRQLTDQEVRRIVVEEARVPTKAPAMRAAAVRTRQNKSIWHKPWPYIAIGVTAVVIVVVAKNGGNGY